MFYLVLFIVRPIQVVANYYGNKMYYADTASVEDKGRFTFPSPPAVRVPQTYTPNVVALV